MCLCAALLGSSQKRAPFAAQGNGDSFDFGREYAWQEELYGLEGRPPDPVLANGAVMDGAAAHPDSNGDAEPGGRRHFGPQWVYLKLSQPVTAPAVRCTARPTAWDSSCTSSELNTGCSNNSRSCAHRGVVSTVLPSCMTAVKLT